MVKSNENPKALAGDLEVLGNGIADHSEFHTPYLRRLQAFRIATRFGLMPSTAALIAELAFPAAITIGGGA